MTPEEYIHGRFMKIGKSVAFTSALAEQIRSGVPEIKHPYSEKDIDGNEAKATFHIKKSEQNNYFLNKMDLEVKKAGKNDVVRETFYINDIKRYGNKQGAQAEEFHTTFTFKKAFNYLLGRPVLNEYQNQAGQSKKEWDQIDFQNKLGEGRFGKKSFKDGYGFESEKVASHYSIIDLAKPVFKTSLFESIERGNLQKTKFVGNGGEVTPLYVSPNIMLGSFNVFRFNEKTNKKDLVQLEELEKKGWITKEYAQTIKERVAEITKKNTQTHKVDKPAHNTTTQKEKPIKKAKKVGDKSEVKEKKTRKNKQNI